MVDHSSTFSDGTCENFDFQVFESSFEGYQVAVRQTNFIRFEIKN